MQAPHRPVILPDVVDSQRMLHRVDDDDVVIADACLRADSWISMDLHTDQSQYESGCSAPGTAGAGRPSGGLRRADPDADDDTI